MRGTLGLSWPAQRAVHLQQDLSPPSPSSRDLTSSLPNKQLIQQKGNPEMHPGERPQKELGKERNHQTKHHPPPPPKRKSCQCVQNSRKSSNRAALRTDFCKRRLGDTDLPGRSWPQRFQLAFGPAASERPELQSRNRRHPRWRILHRGALSG